MVRVDAAGPRAELVHVGLPRQHGAARPQLRHARRVRRAPPRRPQPPRPACVRTKNFPTRIRVIAAAVHDGPVKKKLTATVNDSDTVRRFEVTE